MSESPSNLILVQPGSTEFDEKGLMVGRLDLPLSRRGEDEAKSIAADLAETDYHLIVCAPQLAAQQTAQLLSRDGDVKVKVDENLSNLDLGLWTGKGIDELKDTQPKLYKLWQEQPESVTPPEGETIESATERVRKALKWIQKKNRLGTVVVISAHPLAAIVQSEVLDETIAEFWDPHPGCGTYTLLASSELSASR